MDDPRPIEQRILDDLEDDEPDWEEYPLNRKARRAQAAEDRKRRKKK